MNRMNDEVIDDDGDAAYVPATNFTTDQRDKALRDASTVDPYKLIGDDERHQLIEGDINRVQYHRAVMLLVCSRLNTVKFDR